MSEVPGTEISPPMGQRRQDRFDTCGFNPTMAEGSECGLPATWHIIWTLDAENGAACQEHYDDARAKWAFVCAHQRGPDCMMPGSFIDWKQNRCFVEGAGPAVPELAMAAGPPGTEET